MDPKGAPPFSSWGLGELQTWEEATKEELMENRHSPLGMQAVCQGDTLVANEADLLCPCFLEETEEDRGTSQDLACWRH